MTAGMDNDELVWKGELAGEWAGSAVEDVYGALTLEAAVRLAQRAADALPSPRLTTLARVLARVACSFPEAIDGLYGALLDAGVLTRSFWPYALDHGVIFANADDAIASRLVRVLEGTDDRPVRVNARSALGWAGGDVAARAFQQWGDSEAPLQAGWEPTSSGARRLVASEQCRRLAPSADPSPVTVFGGSEAECAWCGDALISLFELELELQSPTLAFLHIAGERLRVLTCEWCGTVEDIYTEIDLDGSARWSGHNGAGPDFVGPGQNHEPALHFGVGALRRTPFEAMQLGVNMSQIGGQATWIQPPQHPVCPRCERRMLFLGQVDGLSETPTGAGMHYAFVHLDCGYAATVYQQT